MKTAEELFNTITSNGCREMTEARFEQALEEYRQSIIDVIDKMIVASREKDKTDLEELRRRKDMELADEMLSESLGYRMSLIDLREKL